MGQDDSSTALAVRAEDVVDVALPGRLHEAGYDLPPDLTFERWVRAGDTLQQMHASINWWIGDWLLHGEAHFSQEAYQAIRDQAGEITGRSEGSLLQAAWVAKRFPVEKRRDPAVLSWSHHREVILADLPDDEIADLIEAAVIEKLSTRDLGERARARKDAIAEDQPHQLAAPAERASKLITTRNGSESEAADSDVAKPGETFSDATAVVDVDVALERTADLLADFAELTGVMMSRLRGEVRHFPACRIGKNVDGYGPPIGAPCSDSCSTARLLLERYEEMYPDDFPMDDDEEGDSGE